MSMVATGCLIVRMNFRPKSSTIGCNTGVRPRSAWRSDQAPPCASCAPPSSRQEQPSRARPAPASAAASRSPCRDVSGTCLAAHGHTLGHQFGNVAIRACGLKPRAGQRVRAPSLPAILRMCEADDCCYLIAMANAASAPVQAAARTWFQNTHRSRKVAQNAMPSGPSPLAARASFIGTLMVTVTTMLPAR